MRFATCPCCEAELDASQAICLCPTCRANWHYSGFPDRCPACEKHLAGASDRCPHCDDDLAATAREIAAYRVKLRTERAAGRWRWRLLIWGGILVAGLLAWSGACSESDPIMGG